MPMEKQGTVENQLAHTIDQTEYDSRYDRTAKKLLANKQILAQIMKNCVNEYSACSVDEIAEKYIEGTPEVGTVGVHVDDVTAHLTAHAGQFCFIHGKPPFHVLLT